MTLANGREYLAIPGPSVIPERVLQAMHRPSPNIYEGELIEMTKTIKRDLKAIARTKHDVAIYIGNGHAAWEAALSNVVAPGETILVLSNGWFGKGWGDMGDGLGAHVEVQDFGSDTVVDPEWLADRLTQDKEQKIKAVMVCQTDTSSSGRNDIAVLRQAIDAVGHPALFMVDCIASLGCDPYEMDAWGVDVTVAACQKGLMVPPGVGLVYFNDKAAAVRAKMPRVSRHWDWATRADPDIFPMNFNGTAPTHHLYGLRASLDMINEEGLEAIWHRHAVLARAIWAACEVWGSDGPLRLRIEGAANRSHAVTSLEIGAPHGTALREWTEKITGVTLGIGLGMSTPDDPNGTGFFRIGHMGHVNAHMVMGALAAMDAGLKALGIPHGRGALEAASEVIAAG